MPVQYDDLSAGKNSSERETPCNFLLVGHVRSFGHPIGVDPARFEFVAPFESDASKCLHLA